MSLAWCAPSFGTTTSTSRNTSSAATPRSATTTSCHSETDASKFIESEAQIEACSKVALRYSIAFPRVVRRRPRASSFPRSLRMR